MWPKALLELAPHLIRLVPTGDRSQTNRTAEDEAHRKAMEELAERLRDDLGQVTTSHSGLYRQLNEQSEQLVGVAAAVETTRRLRSLWDSGAAWACRGGCWIRTCS